ncbi:MAG: hypothetical protein NTX87_07630 [Planctomycetota bacterium]|nr:hypothetical protein [Planctomycetota bacterium]
MKRAAVIVGLLMVGAAIAGCLEKKEEFTLNPDGSGKVVYETIVAMPMMQMGDQKPDLATESRKIAKMTLDGSEGVEAWSDLVCDTTEDGRLRFKGTAYFKDLAKLKLAQSEDKISFAKDPKGGMVLTLEMGNKEEKDPAEPKPKPPATPPTEEQITAQIQQARAGYTMQKAMMGTILGKMKVESSFRLPGTLAEVSGFQKTPEGCVRMMVDGAAMMKAMDEVMADDAALRKGILAGEDISKGPQGDLMTEKLFGKGPMKARVTGDLKPLFDFAAESQAAKAAYPEAVKKLGLDKIEGGMMPMMPMPPGATGAPPAPAAPAAPAAK